MFEVKWVLTEEQKKTVKAWIKTNYDQWVDEGRFSVEDAADAAIEHFGFSDFEEQCDCEGLAQEVEDDRFEAEAYYWGVELGFIKEVK